MTHERKFKYTCEVHGEDAPPFITVNDNPYCLLCFGDWMADNFRPMKTRPLVDLLGDDK